MKIRLTAKIISANFMKTS